MEYEPNKFQNDFQNISDYLISLGDENRQKIIIYLMSDLSCDGFRVNDIAEAIGLSRPAVSYHLKNLKQNGVVDFHSVGTRNYYYLSGNAENILKLQQLVDGAIEIMNEVKKNNEKNPSRTN